MHNINQLTANISQNAHKQTSTQTDLTHSSQQSQNNESELLTKEQIASLFKGWKKLYRSKMKDEDWDMDTVKVWLIVLNDMNTTDQEFNLAKRVSIRHEWPPTHPVDFLKLGRTETASEYPAAQSAFNTACQNCGMRGDVKRNWKHEVIYETANRIGWGVLASATEYYFKTFQGVYDEVVREHKNGERFEIPKERQLAYERTVLQENSPMAATVDDFLNQFKRKHGEVV